MEKKFIKENGCLLCGSKISKELFKKKDLFLDICKDCGMIRLNPHWDKKSYNEYYKEEYDEVIRPQISSKKNDEELRKNRMVEVFMTFKKAGLKNFSPKNILDIGAGNGLDLECLKNSMSNKSSFFSIEPSDFCSKELNRKGFKVISRDAEDDWDESYRNHFDYISIRNVLEHTLNPLKVMEKISNSLTDDGLVYISVPNMSNPDFPLNIFFEIPHTYYFTKKTMKNLLLKSGLSPVLIWDDSKVFSRLLYVIAKKSSSKTTPNFSKKEYEKMEKFISFQLNKEKKKSFKKYMVFYRIKEKLLLPMKIFRIWLFRKRFKLNGLKTF
jgi:2-polyprenyl-3-methyl-5-hydroxy-6-metoxy-1,4-benzoquinol methylase